MDQGQIGEAVLFCLRLYQEIDFLLLFMHDVIIYFDFMEIFRFDDFTDVTQAEGISSDFLKHVRLLYGVAGAKRQCGKLRVRMS